MADQQLQQIEKKTDKQFYHAIRQICKTLRKTRTKQIYKTLARFDANNRVLGKCALGVLSCKFSQKITPQNKGDLNMITILSDAGIPSDWQFREIFPHYYAGEMRIAVTQLYGMIVSLNDSEEFTFKEIADFLEITCIPEGDKN